MRLTRIHLATALSSGSELLLPKEAANHVVRVLRLREGAALIVFDGKGHEYRAELLSIDGGKATIGIREPRTVTTESPLRITLIQGISRGERMDWTLQKATELGVAAIAPVLTSRSVVRLDEKQAAKKQQHWSGIVAGACEQCGRARIPQIQQPGTLRNYLVNVRKEGLRLVLSPSAPGSLAGLTSLPTKVELLIGPEGGLDDEELTSAQKA